RLRRARPGPRRPSRPRPRLQSRRAVAQGSWGARSRGPQPLARRGTGRAQRALGRRRRGRRVEPGLNRASRPARAVAPTMWVPRPVRRDVTTTIDLMNRLHALDAALAACERRAIDVDELRAEIGRDTSELQSREKIVCSL